MIELTYVREKLDSIINIFQDMEQKYDIVVSSNKNLLGTTSLPSTILDKKQFIKRLSLTVSLINDIEKINNYKSTINLFKIKTLYSEIISTIEVIDLNYSSIADFLYKLNNFNTNKVLNIYINENKITATFSSGNINPIEMNYNLFELYIKNERLIIRLTNCIIDIFIYSERRNVNYNLSSLNRYDDDGIFDLLKNIDENGNKYLDLIANIEKNSHEINDFEKKNIDFKKIIEHYTHIKNELERKTKETNEILLSTHTELNTFREMSLSIEDDFNKISNKREEIHTAIKSIDEINKIGDESKEINEFMTKRKKELYEILDDAKNTIKILSGSSIAKHLDKQEKKEASAAKGWLFLSGILLIASLCFTTYGFDKNKLDWNFFIFKILTLPILFSSLIFSMRQYVKRKNIVDSYSYKKTLALSLTGFKKQIDKTSDESQLNYILKTIEILTESPLNDLEKNHIKNELEALDKIRESVIENAISTIKNQQNKPKDSDN